MSKAQTEAPAHRARKPAGTPAGAYRLPDMLGSANWSEADAPLARGLADLSALERAIAAAARMLRKAGEEAHAAALEDGLLVTRQSLMQAVRKRGFTALGVVGAVEPFDPKRHDLVKAARKTPERVKILACGWVRGQGEILARAQVTPSRARGRGKA